MSPCPAPDLDARRDQVIHAARDLAEADGWSAVTVARTRAYLDFAPAHSRVYEAMFSLGDRLVVIHRMLTPKENH